MMIRRFSFLALGLALACPMAHATEPPTSAGCTLIAGGGLQSGSLDAEGKERWNRLNFSFYDAALTALAASDKVEQAFFPIASADPAKMQETLLAQAAKAGCMRVLWVSVFNDLSKAAPELVFALRGAPLQRLAGANGLTVGAAEFDKEYRYAATPATLAKVVPSRIAEQAVQDYLAHRKRRPASGV
jgi:hypothetical protein